LFSSFTLRVFVEQVEFTVTAMPSESQCYQNIVLDGEWKKNKSTGGCMNTFKWIDNPQYKLTCMEPGNVSVTLEQVVAQPNQQIVHIGFYVAEPNTLDSNDYVFEYVKAQEPTKFTSIREITGTFTAQANKSYIIIPCTFQPDIERKFKLKVSYRRDMGANFQLTAMSENVHNVTVKSEWAGIKAGGCPNDMESWKKNPKFNFTMKSDGFVQLLLCQEEKDQKLSGVGIHIFSGTSTDGKEIWKSKAWNFFRLSVAPLKLNAGTYTIVPSTFYKGEERQFTLKAVTKVPCILEETL